jgi:hypothetical protein
VVKRVSIATFPVFQRNFPAPQYIDWPRSSWQTAVWLAVPLI